MIEDIENRDLQYYRKEKIYLNDFEIFIFFIALDLGLRLTQLTKSSNNEPKSSQRV